MKVLDLQCARQHVFEGWFGSEDDFQSQLARGLVACPLCSDAQISKRLSAPRLNLGASRPATQKQDSALARPAMEGPPGSKEVGRAVSEVGSHQDGPALSPQQAQAMQAQWLHMVRHVMANTQDVGPKFAEVARQMHYGETEERSIRGQASPEETMSLLEEGIAVMPLPIPDALKEPLQ